MVDYDLITEKFIKVMVFFKSDDLDAKYDQIKAAIIDLAKEIRKV